jgi:rhamnosyltransferase
MVTVGPRQREGDGTSYLEDNRSAWFFVSILACGSPSLRLLLESGEESAWRQANGFSGFGERSRGFDLVGCARMMVSGTHLKPRVGAVVVLYNPESDVLENLRLLAVQVDALVIVDNGSSEEFRVLLGPMLNARVGLIRHPENLGIATGFNSGIRRLIELGCEFSLTFDQDSRVAEDFVLKIVDAFLEARKQFAAVAVVSPQWKDENSGIVYDHELKAGAAFGVLKWTISSGNCIDNQVFKSVGYFEDGYFIDGVDLDFHLRCRKLGFCILKTSRVGMSHHLGLQKRVRIFSFEFTITLHNRVRKYYIARNKIKNMKRHFWFDPACICKDLWYFLGDILTIVLYDDDKSEKLQFTFLGVKHGFQGVDGKLVDQASS